MHCKPSLARFEPICLDELNACARMMTRVDRKYLLTGNEACELLASLPQSTRILEINGRFLQHYRTSYLDSSSWGSYFTAAFKRRRRYKVRMRGYVDSGIAFLEVKTRGPRGTTVKERVPIEVEEAYGDRIPQRLEPWLAQTLEARRVDVGAEVGALRPTLRNEYWRATFKPEGEGRVTVDSDLRWHSSRGGHLEGLDLVFVETKSGARPSVVDRQLWAMGLRPQKVYKFGTGLAVMHPELPSNKWRRAMRTFEAARVSADVGADIAAPVE